jgi:hypothetical protein
MPKKKAVVEISIREYARRKKVTHTAVRAWVESGLPLTSAGKVEPKTADAWLLKYRASAGNLVPADGISLAEATRRKEIALMRLREVEAAKADGQAVSITDATRALGDAISTARSRLLSIPPAVAPELALTSDPAECQRIVHDAIHEALRDLARGAVQPATTSAE